MWQLIIKYIILQVFFYYIKIKHLTDIIAKTENMYPLLPILNIVII